MRKRAGARSGRREAHAPADDPPRKAKFNFEMMRLAATNDDADVRKEAFIDYFERFGEFPSYLFDNEPAIDERLQRTIRDLLQDENVSKDLHKGIEALMERLST